MKYRIEFSSGKLTGSVTLNASKSESNRVLLIRELCEQPFEIVNLSTAQDTVIMQEILAKDKASFSDGVIYDVGAAGTVMRFLCAYFAVRPGVRVLTGNDRMKKRPIGILVDALCALGADIEYLEEFGYPPVRINGKKLQGGEIEIDGNISSQYISALLMISTELQNGLVLKFTGNVTSRPYINMTLKMMEEFRVYGQWHHDAISVSRQRYQRKSEPDYVYAVEGDWSAASYWYAFAALSKECNFLLKGVKQSSIQGDAVLSDLMVFFGVKSEFTDQGLRISKTDVTNAHFGFDFSDCPDLAQTIAVVCAGLGIPAWLNGLHTLKIKETDRLEALCVELKKLNVAAKSETGALRIDAGAVVNSGVEIETYDDHRMALSFTALAMLPGGIIINDAAVIRKSYPDFWKHLRGAGFRIEELS